MKKKLLSFILLLSVGVFTFITLTSVFGGGDHYYEPYSMYKPVLMNSDLLETSVYITEARSLKKTGKIYFKDNYIFISEKYEGVHIINNEDQRHPINEAFINVPGCLDMAIKKNTLYVDNATDLVALDLTTDPKKFQVIKRVKNIIPELLSPDGLKLDSRYVSRPPNTTIVKWIKINE